MTKKEAFKLFDAGIKYGHVSVVNEIKACCNYVCQQNYTDEDLHLVEQRYASKNHPHYYEYKI